MDWILLLQFSVPVALAALGETVSQKSGVINIGLEGMMLLGAFFAMLVSLLTGSPWLGFGAGVGVGVVTALITWFFSVKLSGDQVVVGTAVNLVALGLTSSLYRARFGESGQLLTVPGVPGDFDLIMVLTLLSVPAVSYLLFRTNWGLAARGAGEYPEAVQASGFSVHRVRLVAMLIGGAFAGLGGAYLSLGIAESFAENMTLGRGFIALAIVTFGRWKPLFVFLAAIFIGYLDSLQITLQAKGHELPFQLFLALPYVVALVVLVVVGKGTAMPAALGKGEIREKRALGR